MKDWKASGQPIVDPKTPFVHVSAWYQEFTHTETGEKKMFLVRNPENPCINPLRKLKSKRKL